MCRVEVHGCDESDRSCADAEPHCHALEDAGGGDRHDPGGHAGIGQRCDSSSAVLHHFSALFAVSTYQAMVPECSELSLASACRTGGALIFEERKRGSGDFQILQGMVARGGNTSLSRSFLFFRLLTTEGAERERGFWGCKDHIPFGQRLIMQGWGSKQ